MKFVVNRLKFAAIWRSDRTLFASAKPAGWRRRDAMLKRLILCQLTILAVALANLPVSQAQTLTIPDRGEGRRHLPTPTMMRISSYEDDPFVAEPLVRRMDAARFSVDEDGRPILRSNLVSVGNESKIYRKDPQTGVYKPFAWNPWPPEPTANQQGDFRFPDEERFPLHRVERDSDGKIILKDGLQVWTPNDRRLGSTTVFEAAHAVKDAAELWAGRDILWGQNGLIEIEPQAFVEFNAFFSPITQTLHFGVVPYRLPGQTDIKIFETEPEKLLSIDWHEPGRPVGRVSFQIEEDDEATRVTLTDHGPHPSDESADARDRRIFRWLGAILHMKSHGCS